MVTIVDPCLSAEIESNIFATVMQEYQLEAQTLPLNIVMPPNSWKWYTDIDKIAKPSLSSLTCPPITYQILEIIDNVATPTDLVIFDTNLDPFGNTLKF